METKNLKEKGEVDYDYKHDILFFKTQNKEYARSIELDNMVLDIDTDGFIVGIQIMEASAFFNLEKRMLLKVPNWEFSVSVHNGRIEFRLTFQIAMRNKIIEKNPIIMQSIEEKLPDSEMVCVTA